MKIIPLTRGKKTIIDDQDFDRISKYKWCIHCDSYAVTSINGKIVMMHRFLLKTPEGFDTDHINGNKLDNRRSNLRIVTRSQNMANTRIRRSNKSGYKGVFYFKFGHRSKRWKAKIKVNYKMIDLGYFLTKEEAAKVYNLAAVKHFGEYALLNVL